MKHATAPLVLLLVTALMLLGAHRPQQDPVEWEYGTLIVQIEKGVDGHWTSVFRWQDAKPEDGYDFPDLISLCVWISQHESANAATPEKIISKLNQGRTEGKIPSGDPASLNNFLNEAGHLGWECYQNDFNKRDLGDSHSRLSMHFLKRRK